MRSLIPAIFLIISVSVNAQKLPTIQQASVRAPANVKIDGQTTEWGEKLQAYNPATEIFYTIANDDKNLYLIFQATDRYNITRIVNGGIKLSIQKNGSKNDAGAPSVQFPYQEKGKRVSFIQRLDLAGVTGQRKDHLLDSAMQANNKKLRANVKQIYTKGIPEVDSLLSIYNEQAIQAANAFDVEKVYTAEIAVDLKHFGLSIADASKFSYHIVLNGGANRYSMGISFGPAINDDGSPMPKAQSDALAAALNKEVEIKSLATDFWGEYTLAK